LPGPFDKKQPVGFLDQGMGALCVEVLDDIRLQPYIWFILAVCYQGYSRDVLNINLPPPKPVGNLDSRSRF